MKSKKLVAAILSASILSLSAVTAFAANTEDIKPINTYQLEQVIPIKAEKVYYNSYTGTVKDIKDYNTIEGSKLVGVENSDGVPSNILISKDTYILNNEKITAGSIITVYYKADAPMILIWPTQYNAEVVVVESKDQNVKVSVFGKDLISEDNRLKLNISDTTEITLHDKTAFKGDLTNKKLAVIYSVSTKSIPAQTTPSKIIVLSEKEEIKTPALDVSKMDFIVNNKKLEAPAAYTNQQGIVMVPIRAISEALGYKVNWDGKLKSVTLDKSVTLTIGQDYYTYLKTAPIQLGAAPEIVNERTYIPLSFFREVARLNNAYVLENQIVIDNNEKMN